MKRVTSIVDKSGQQLNKIPGSTIQQQVVIVKCFTHQPMSYRLRNMVRKREHMYGKATMRDMVHQGNGCQPLSLVANGLVQWYDMCYDVYVG